MPEADLCGGSGPSEPRLEVPMAFVITDGAVSRASPDSPAGSNRFLFDPVSFTSTFLFDFCITCGLIFLVYLLYGNVQLSDSSLICQSETS